MPYSNPITCFICGITHPCDTNNTLQLVNPNFITVNVCKHHNGILQEHSYQNSLPPDQAATLARKVISTPHFQLTYKNYINHLIQENPHHKTFLESLNFL